jgi:ectoine hydroxylase-related dioxygenase (phytanoyl-CoA dioxygenase family)
MTLTDTVWCLPNKGQEFIDLLEHNRTIDDFVPDFLGDDAILFSYTANIARPGNTPMHMHTDQITIQPPVRSMAFGMNLMYFLEDITEENGGTLVMPGSHKGNWAPDDPHSTVDTVAAAGPAGTCMVFESRIWHATGANKQPGSERPVILVFFVRACMRQQENFQLSVKDEVVNSCSDKVKGYMGWRTTGSVGGVQGFGKDWTIVKRPAPDEIIGVMGGESRGLSKL